MNDGPGSSAPEIAASSAGSNVGDHPPAAPASRAALAFIFVTVTIDILAFGVIIPVLPHLVQELVGGSIAQASVWSGIFSTIFALTQLVCSPIQGALSDRFGRRPVILGSCFGLAVDFAVMALAQTLPLLLAGRVVSGITAASFSTANAYIADVTPPQKRAGAFGMLGAAFGIGFVVGPALGSLLSTIDVRAPFWGAAGLAACNFLYGLFVLPESLPPERRSKAFEARQANPFGALSNLRRYPNVIGLATVLFVLAVAHYVLPAVFVLYADHRYRWDQRMVGYVLAGAGVCGAVVQAGLAGRVVAKIGERRTLLLGVGFGVLGFAIYGLAPTGAWFLVGIPVLSLWGLANPATQAMASRQVAADEQGRLQGAISGLTSLGGVFAPFLFASVFAAAIDEGGAVSGFPGAPFLLASALVLVAGIVAWRVTRAGHVGAAGQEGGAKRADSSAGAVTSS
jgi:DHA1 family tetracycline resistance protein-like MFS transporter